ncbi:hypothetical protein Micbo1qcDRAFT_178331 [Microdochium bolleyi]|uniref:Apple domain-containing protein n=1 Tax=Microdochium bolleyi TaxID=196109 RepID=A0A136ITG3_9PEZI|nr:hypothetical protein Micbo1qcDRAFT_178331 [Microdochium bolleyi]
MRSCAYFVPVLALAASVVAVPGRRSKCGHPPVLSSSTTTELNGACTIVSTVTVTSTGTATAFSTPSVVTSLATETEAATETTTLPQSTDTVTSTTTLFVTGTETVTDAATVTTTATETLTTAAATVTTNTPSGFIAASAAYQPKARKRHEAARHDIPRAISCTSLATTTVVETATTTAEAATPTAVVTTIVLVTTTATVSQEAATTLETLPVTEPLTTTTTVTTTGTQTATATTTETVGPTPTAYTGVCTPANFATNRSGYAFSAVQAGNGGQVSLAASTAQECCEACVAKTGCGASSFEAGTRACVGYMAAPGTCGTRNVVGRLYAYLDEASAPPQRYTVSNGVCGIFQNILVFS